MVDKSNTVCFTKDGIVINPYSVKLHLLLALGLTGLLSLSAIGLAHIIMRINL